MAKPSSGLKISAKLRNVLEQIPEYEQDLLAEKLEAMLAADEAAWGAAFSDSSDKLEKLGDEALKAIHSGSTKPLDPEKL
jgi:hypothetical protein